MRPDVAFRKYRPHTTLALICVLLQLVLLCPARADNPCQRRFETERKAVGLYLKSRDQSLNARSRDRLRDEAAALLAGYIDSDGEFTAYFPNDCDYDTQFYANFADALFYTYSYSPTSGYGVEMSLATFKDLEVDVGRAELSSSLFAHLLNEDVQKLRQLHWKLPGGRVFAEMLGRWNISY